MGKDLETVHGTYTEIWISNSQWRRETLVNDFRRVEVGGPNKLWLLDDAKDFPETATRLPDLLNVFSKPVNSDFESLTETSQQGKQAKCAITKPNPQNEKRAFCFESKTGALLNKSVPEIRLRNAVVYSCFYGEFRKFGDFWFPREMACFEDKHSKLEAQVLALTTADFPIDPSLFTPPQGAREIPTCSGPSTNPVATLTSEPAYPLGPPRPDTSVLLSLIVDTEGKTQNIKVIQSGDKDRDEAAVATVRKWRYKPATCAGKPFPMEINVRVDFNPPLMMPGSATRRP